jgi:acetyltransferase-like isoleucine patch superfamily enzyme
VADFSDLARRGIVCDPSVILTGRNVFETPVRLFGGTLAGSSIGAYSTVAKGTVIRVADVGRYCSIGDDCIIGPARHPVDWLSTTSFPYVDNAFGLGLDTLGFPLFEPLQIGNDVWVGARSCIMGGVHVRHGAIVAMGAVVTKDVPPYAIVGGTPAKVIRYRFGEKLIERLLAYKWWQYDLPAAAKAGANIAWNDPERALDQIEEARLAYKVPPIANRAVTVNVG